jgi:hypothetical protein
LELCGCLWGQACEGLRWLKGILLGQACQWLRWLKGVLLLWRWRSVKTTRKGLLVLFCLDWCRWECWCRGSRRRVSNLITRLELTPVNALLALIRIIRLPSILGQLSLLAIIDQVAFPLQARLLLMLLRLLLPGGRFLLLLLLLNLLPQLLLVLSALFICWVRATRFPSNVGVGAQLVRLLALLLLGLVRLGDYVCCVLVVALVVHCFVFFRLLLFVFCFLHLLLQDLTVVLF